MFEEQGPDACLCERNIALVREARVQQLLSRHWQDRPAPARLPDDLREIWNDKEALKARSNEPIVVASRALEQRPRPKSKMPGRVALGLGPLVTEEGYTSGSSDSRDTAERSKEAAVAQDALHQAEPAAGHQAVPAARAAGAGCQPAAGAGCQPVDPAPVAAGPGPPPKAAPASLRHRDRRDGGDPAAAPFWAAVAAESVDLLNLDDAAAGAGTDAGRPGHRPTENPMTRILDGMQELRDGMGGLEAALAVMAPAMATKVWRLETAMEKMFKRLDDMEEKVQSLQHGWKVVPEGAAEGAAEDHEGEASGPVCAHSMDAGGATATDASLVDDADPPTQEERRQADDNRWYTEKQFQEYYRDHWWRDHWKRATRDPTARAASAAQRVPPQGSAAPAHDVPRAASAAEPVK